MLKEGEKFFAKKWQHKTKVESSRTKAFAMFYNYGIMIIYNDDEDDRDVKIIDMMFNLDKSVNQTLHFKCHKTWFNNKIVYLERMC